MNKPNLESSISITNGLAGKLENIMSEIRTNPEESLSQQDTQNRRKSHGPNQLKT